jgi:hypothetical protein
MRSWTCAPSARSVDALVDSSSALTLPTKAKTLAAAATIKRKLRGAVPVPRPLGRHPPTTIVPDDFVMTNLLELAISRQ